MLNVDVNFELLEIKFHAKNVLKNLEEKGLKHKAEAIIKLVDDVLILLK